MYQILKGMRVVEGASFIAGPSCCLHLLQLGAEVIRFDMIGGGPDYRRWPLAPSGGSLYWEGLNKGKKSIAIDLASKKGRELALRIATAQGENAGMFVTNYPVEGFLAHEKLAALRADIITVRVMGWADGRNAVDYTVNATIGVPLLTGPVEHPADRPVNHILPAWDLITGSYAAFALMAAERNRRITGLGAEIRVPLSDVAAAALGNTGQIAEVVTAGQDRPRMGNDLFGAFGRDFPTRDGVRIMLVAITARQWTGLLEALEITAGIAAIEAEEQVSFADEGQRFIHRERIFPLVEAALQRRTLAEIAPVFDAKGVCWSRYRGMGDAIAHEAGFVAGNPVFAAVAHPAGETYPTPGAAASFMGVPRDLPLRAPRLGEHTDEVLATVLDMSAMEIARLHDDGVVAGPKG